MKFWNFLLFFITIPHFISSSNFDRLSHHVIGQATKIFYSRVFAIVQDTSLASFIEKLEPVLNSAFEDKSAMTAFELSSVVLEHLKQRLQEMGQWESQGKMIYDIFLEQFSTGFTQMYDYPATFDNSSSSSTVENLQDHNPPFPDYFSFDERFTAAASVVFFEGHDNISEISLNQPAKIDSSFVSKRSNSQESDQKKWTMAILKLDVLPSRLFEFSSTIANETISLAIIEVINIYENLKMKFNKYILDSTPFSEDLFNDDFQIEINGINSLSPILDQETKISSEIVDIVMKVAEGIITEIRQSFKDSDEDEEDDSRDSKRLKLSSQNYLSKSSDENEEVEGDENVVEVAFPEELEFPQNRQMFDNPFETIRSTCLEQDSTRFKEIRGLYWALLEKEFPDLKPKALEFLLNRTDDFIIATYRL